MSIIFEFTKSPELLEQYYRIRQDCFRRDLGIDEFDGSEDIYDRVSDIIIARIGDRCVGGARLTGNRSLAGALLPMENDSFRFSQVLSGLGLYDGNYCQCGRLALLPEFRNMDTVRGIFDGLINRCIEFDYAYAFNVASLNHARLYKRLHSSLGFDYRVFSSVDLPREEDFEGLEHFLSISFLDKEYSGFSASDRLWIHGNQHVAEHYPQHVSQVA